MSMDYKKKTYRPHRPDTRNITSYGSMSKWISRMHESPVVNVRGDVARHLIERAHPTPQFTKKRPRITASPAGMPTMHDTYVETPALDASVPAHLRYSNHCAYDDFH